MVLVAVAATLAVQRLADDDAGDTATETTAADGSDATTDATETSLSGPAGSFEDGLHVIGRDIEPGRYIAAGLTGTCEWTRLADLGGNQPLASAEGVSGHAVVDIAADDAAFRSQNCGVWETYLPPTTPLITTLTDGDWVIGEQVEPGTYQSNVADAARCTWTHASGFTHTTQEVIESHFDIYPGDAPPAVVQLRTGERFSTRECEPWAKID